MAEEKSTELPQPVQDTPDNVARVSAVDENDEKRQLTLEEVAKEYRNGNRKSKHGFKRAEIRQEIVRQIQERVPSK